MSSSPPPTKKFFLKPSALKVPTPNLESASTVKPDEPAKCEPETTDEEADIVKGNSFLRPSILKVQTPSTPVDIKTAATDSSKISFPPLSPPKESSDLNTKSPQTTESKDNDDKNQQVTNGHQSTFVFGERLEDRVTITEQTSPNPKKAVEDQPKIVIPDKDAEGADDHHEKEGQRKRPFEVLTGEEDETNVLQIHCKLYQWEADEQVWREKGNGSLKLNDKMRDGKLGSRLVMRTSGNLKVILNSSLVVGMKFSKSNEKSLRFTNVDGIYTVKGKEKDIELLFSAVDYRLRELAKKIKCDGVSDVDTESADGMKRDVVEEDETNSRSEVDGDESNKVTSPKVVDASPSEGERGCFSTIREQANVDDLSN